MGAFKDELCKLDWHTRFRIIKGICDGLKYIHKDLQKPIYHLDLKPDNILLDKDMVPKIADFGLSRIFVNELARITRRHYGTPGYQPPEYIDKGEISGMFDIFSLGTIMIQIVSGRKDYSECLDMSSDEFTNQVRIDWRNRLQATCTGDSFEAYCHQVETCTQIALNCVETESQKRPDIMKITEKLNELEIDNGKLPQKGYHKAEMIMESKYITDPHHNSNLCSGPSCNELEFVDAPETSSDVVEELIVGRTEEKDKVMASLVKAMLEKIAILPICGLGGIGKTTFARLIYSDPKFKHYSQVWVHVSQRFDLNKIRESIISQLSSEESLTNERQMIHGCLPELLSHKKILIVLDNLWEDNQFQLEELKDMLYHEDSNIIILVTTRSERVAERICTNFQPYKILPLTNDMCWDIIKQRSGFEDRDDKEQLMGIGQKIAQKCGGVALAAQSLGFTLRSMNFYQWMKVNDSDIWTEHNSKDFSLPKHVFQCLELSYSYMSPCLKQCFTYCATFPKGHKIVKDDLIYQWISLGFINPTKLLSSMQLCENNIVQLLGLSFFQQPVSPKTSEVYHEQASFLTMHDLVHDLADSLLGNQILDQNKQGNTRGSSCQYALLNDCSKPLELCLTSRARLITLRFLDSCRSKQLRGSAFAPARSLQVLDLSECLQRLPDSIGQLMQLRYLNASWIKDEIPECITKLSNLIYLNLHGSNIGALPKSIGDLERLMHLDLSDCSKIHGLPISFWNLENLTHLDLSGCTSIISVQHISLQRLRQLKHLNLSKCPWIGKHLKKGIGGLTEMQYLNLSGVPCSPLEEVLVNLTKLRYLNLKGSLGMRLKSEAVPECISSLSNLEYLNLGSNGNLYSIPETIGKLRKLITLDLSYCYNLQRLPASVSATNSMKFLHVFGCSKLDKSTLPQNKSSSALLPHFVVHAGDDDPSSNLSELGDKHPTLLEIRRLENVKFSEEAKGIRLVEKQSIRNLELAWTRNAKRFVDDAEVLRELVPPDTVELFTLQGYNSISFPSWMMTIATYLPRMRKCVMKDLPSCEVLLLPPLGQLPSLECLEIGGMDSIRKIDGDIYGGKRAFPQLLHFSLSHMKCLKEWISPYPVGEDGLNELAFPKLEEVIIDCCPSLRFKECLPPCKRSLFINSSDEVLFTSSVSCSAATPQLFVTCCGEALQWWSLLRHLPCLTHLEITDCEDLTCWSTDLLRCISSLKTLIVQQGPDPKYTTHGLPECLGDLTSLTEIKILNCKGINAMPDSIQQLSCLQDLEIKGCPELVRWCKSRVNKMKLTHIRKIRVNGKKFF
ncbi:unnamed protein product [Urochloa decumbens]|uniref:non-specific serine/threonine protein kinase n=1 Tax=Urochloa decumbens TaxID=240449 RepID=A0ABC9AQS6_9POAL